jgi:hypothetical protein
MNKVKGEFMAPAYLLPKVDHQHQLLDCRVYNLDKDRD